MQQLVAIVVYSWLAGTPVGDFGPHETGAMVNFVAANPDRCGAWPGKILSGVTVEKCQRALMLSYLPGFLEQHPDRIFLGAECRPHRPSPLNLEVLKRRFGQ